MDNQAEGISYEISQDAVIRNNRVYRNSIHAKGWYWDGGITVASSFNVEVYGNRLSGNYNGITGTQQDRPDSTPPAHLLDNYHVHDNVICATHGEHPRAWSPTTAPTWPRATSASPGTPSSRPRVSSGPPTSAVKDGFASITLVLETLQRTLGWISSRAADSWG